MRTTAWGVNAMCRAMTPVVIGLLCANATCLCAAQLPVAAPVQVKSDSPVPQTVVLPLIHLNGPADLEKLRETNLYHYLRAKRILAAVDKLCAPKPLHTYLARFSAADPQCGDTWMTSFPPKRQLMFHLDRVYYVALVTVTAEPHGAPSSRSTERPRFALAHLNSPETTKPAQ